MEILRGGSGVKWGYPGDPVQLLDQTRILGLSAHGLGSCREEESWSVHPQPTFPTSWPALGSPLDTTGFLALGGKALGTGRKGLGDRDWSEEVWPH